MRTKLDKVKGMTFTGGLDLRNLEELKATAAKLHQQIEALEKPKQWEPSGEFYAIHHSLPTSTETAAVKATSAIRTNNRLLAYVDEFGGDWVADWSCRSQGKYFIHYDTCTDTWIIAIVRTTLCLGVVYMSQYCVEGLIAKLRSGEVVL
jgi:hypothetical protein